MAARSPARVLEAPAELVPVAPNERVQLFDVLRGFCLFGVLLSNLNDWYGTADPVRGLDGVLHWAQDWLIESRFYSMLGFLFGIGFAIQLMRAADRGQDVRSMFYRRMGALLVLGALHGLLIWQGDILTTYALLGFVLVMFRRLSPRKLLLAAAATWMIIPYAVVRGMMLLNISWAPIPWLEPVTEWTYAHGTWGQTVVLGAQAYLYHLGRFSWISYPSFLALFLLGLWAIRTNAVSRLTARRRHLISALLVALACWGVAVYIGAKLPQWWPVARGSAPNWHHLRFWVARVDALRLGGEVATWSSSAAYALLFALAMSYRAAARKLQPLAALGRMTLTTYLVQSVVCTTLFYPWGFGWYGKVGYTGMFLLTVILFSVQVMFSVWWLRRYRFGPAEWLWRSLAYGKRQAMWIGDPVASAPAAETV